MRVRRGNVNNASHFEFQAMFANFETIRYYAAQKNEGEKEVIRCYELYMECR